MFDIIVLILLILIAIPSIIYLYLTWNFNYWRKRGITTAQPLSIFGSISNIVTRKRNIVFDIHNIYEKYKRDSRAVGIFITRKPEILLLHPKLIHDVLVTNFTQFHDTITSSYVDNRKEDKFVSRNPFWCAGEEWKQRRSEAVAGLTQNKLKQSFAIWENSCKKLRNFMEQKLSRKMDIIETKDLSYRFTADVMCDFIWGIDSGTLTSSGKSTILEVSRKWTNHTFAMLQSFLMLTAVPFWRRIRPCRFFPEDTDEFFANLQRDAIEMRKKQLNAERPDFLNHLLQLSERKQLSNDDFTGHSLTLLLDGLETSGVVLMLSLYYLALNPEIQDKLRLEIQTALKEQSTQSISFEELISLPYLDQCVHETLRLATVIPTFFRICTQETLVEVVEGKTVEIPAGMVAVIPAYSLHFDEKYYSEPKKYKPERFDNAAHVEFTKKGLFLPFGDGPRICMGMRIGLLSVKSAVVEILSNYEITKCPLTPAENSKNASSFALTLDGDVMLRYQKLENVNI